MTDKLRHSADKFRKDEPRKNREASILAIRNSKKVWEQPTGDVKCFGRCSGKDVKNAGRISTFERFSLNSEKVHQKLRVDPPLDPHIQVKAPDLERDLSMEADLLKVRPHALYTPPKCAFEENARSSRDELSHIAWVIPVGGKSRREEQLKYLVETLKNQGVSTCDVYAIEDDGSRLSLQTSGGTRQWSMGYKSLLDLAEGLKIHLVQSHLFNRIIEIYADISMTSKYHGYNLARHYRFMFDYVLVGKDALGNDSRESPIIYTHAVFLEDDLSLAPDFVHYFSSMSRVMEEDQSVFCVSAHNDNGFVGTSVDKEGELDPLDLDFRRGQHFMAPGWMTSSKIWKSLREDFMDENGWYKVGKFPVRKGHWDVNLNFRLEGRECIFPAVPRMKHILMSSKDAVTTSTHQQLYMFDNLRLSKRHGNDPYGDLSWLTSRGYEDTLSRFLEKAVEIRGFSNVQAYRNQRLKVLIPAVSDSDEIWNTVIGVEGYFGLVAIGGSFGGLEQAKPRGVHNGMVILDYLTNRIAVVGKYSPYVGTFSFQESKIELNHLGCFVDKKNDRDLEAYSGTATGLDQCGQKCFGLGYRYMGTVQL